MAEGGSITDLIDASVDATIGALEAGSTPVPRDSRRSIGGGLVASTPARASPVRIMHSSGVSRKEYIMATSREIQELRDAGLHAAADGMQQALDRYIAGEAGPGSGSAGGGSSTAVPPAVQADKHAGFDLEKAFQKAVFEQSDVKALKGTIGIGSTPDSVRVAVAVVLQRVANVQGGPVISAIIHQALLLDPVQCIAVMDPDWQLAS